MQTKYKILRIDPVHPSLDEILTRKGFQIDQDLSRDYNEIIKKIHLYDGLILRSAVKVDKQLIDKASRLKFIARVGSGTEGIDLTHAASRGIRVFSAPEGNRNAVAEMTVGLLIGLLRNINKADNEIKSGRWLRSSNRGFELEGKTLAIIGYGNTGKALAKKLAGFEMNLIFYDIRTGLEDEFARQTDMEEIFQTADILSLHVPLTEKTRYLVNKDYISRFKKHFFLINTSRGEVVKTEDLVMALEQGKIKGAALDVIEYENPAFGDMIWQGNIPGSLRKLMEMPQVILTPHIAGITYESSVKLARVTAQKILSFFENT